jgi:undecaprenyl diphosphate synthase
MEDIKMNEEKIPNHVAIILDGNRRWAREHKLPKLEGHRRGFENIRKLTNYIFSRGVKYLSVFAFSTENFKRTQDEVKYLMDMFVREFKKEYVSLHKDNIKVIFSGRKSGLRDDVLDAMEEISSLTKDNTGGVFNICLNYGGHAEIVDATKDIVKLVLDNKLSIDDITEEEFAKHLYQDLPPLDFVIRTSGELRLSNFMLYQASYAEFYFPKIYFPDFTEHDFDAAIVEFNKRNRRFGGNAS